MKTLIAISLTVLSLSAFSQEVMVPDLVTTNVGQFNSTCPVENLIVGLNAATTEATPFPYEVTTQFTSTGIGYISSSGVSTGTLVFEYDSPIEVADMLVWNAYFTIETNHSINSCQLIYFDDLDNNLGSDLVTVPIANLANDEAFVVPLTTTANVSKIELHVNSLHGGNEISLRRIAFRGEGGNSGCTDSLACNYDPTATTDDGSCEFGGCTDSTACNFESSAACDDGSCLYPCPDLAGCMDPTAINYYPAFEVDDGSCVYSESLCGENTVWDETSGTCIGLVNPCPADFDENGVVSTSDLLIFLVMFGSEC